MNRVSKGNNMDDQDLLQLIRANRWHHDFEILPGIWTHGAYNPESLFAMLELPADMSGLRAADIGASNGFYSLRMHERGADVSAFDMRHQNVSGFALATKAKGVNILHHQVNLLELDPEKYGQFDVVLLLGVIYHVPDPLRVLRNILAMARKRLLLESYCVDALPGITADMPVVTYMPDPRRRPAINCIDDHSNFWGFTSTALRLIMEDLGCTVRRIVRFNGDRVLVDADYVPDLLAVSRTDFAYGVVGSSESGLTVI
jgi:tRNA (mo5U34)-methyltransferase